MEVICSTCARTFKNQGGLNLHGRSHQKTLLPKIDRDLTSTVADFDTPALALQSALIGKKTLDEVVFYSVKRPSMLVIVRPSQWKEVETGPNSTKLIQTEGLEAQFEAGQFKTDNPEIIAYLETKYQDPRFPILSQRQMREMATR